MDEVFEKFIFDVASALEPYLSNIVFAGGTASYLYHYHPLARRLEFDPIKTVDVDIVTPNPLLIPKEGVPILLGPENLSTQNNVNQRLINHGFDLVLSSTLSGESAVQKFYPKDEIFRKENFHLEFLCPLKGNEVDKKTGRRKLTGEIQKHLTAQMLRYVDLLLLHPWSICVTDPTGVKKDLTIQIPHPLNYIAQKVLIAGDRKQQRGQKYEKDCYYIFEAAALFRRESKFLAMESKGIFAQCNYEQKQWMRRFFETSHIEFCSERSPFVLSLISYARKIANPLSAAQVVSALNWIQICYLYFKEEL